MKYLGYKYDTKADVELFSWAIPLTGGLAFYNWFRFKDGKRVYLLRTLPGEETEMPPYLFYDLLAFESGDGSILPCWVGSKPRTVTGKRCG